MFRPVKVGAVCSAIMTAGMAMGVAAGACRHAGGGSTPQGAPAVAEPQPRRFDGALRGGPSAWARIEAKSGSTLQGAASFETVNEGVRVVVAVSGATPGVHAVHVHEKGDCSGADAAAAGGHFNPEHHPHGLPATPERHLGDLGNMTVDEKGIGNLEITVENATLAIGHALSYVGRAVVVHAAPDTGAQPTGAAGERVGCGVIRTLPALTRP